MLTLRPYQETMISEVRAELMAGRNPLIVSPCGSGKGSLISYMVNGAVKNGHHVIFAVHGMALVEDMHGRVEKLGIPHGVLMGGKRRERWHPVQIASIDTLHRMQHPPKAGLIICDECFVAGTRVTLDDKTIVPIEAIVPGDIVMNADGYGCVTSVRRTLGWHELVEVVLSNGEWFRCTPEHPFFTTKGWVEAQFLDGQEVLGIEAVSALWDGDDADTENVREEMEISEVLRSILREESREPDVSSWGQGSNGVNFAKNWTSAKKARWKWNRPNGDAGSIVGSTWGGVEGGVCDSDQNQAWERVPDMLQGRLGTTQQNDCNRDRRSVPLHAIEKISGSKKGRIAGAIRVESVSRVERSGGVAVYNLEVSGHPSYFANGVLVHNCHMSMSPTWRKTLDLYPEARIIGATATPIRLDGKGLGKKTGGLFDSLVLGPNEAELIRMGFLVRSRVIAAKPIDLKGVKKTAGDFNSKQLAEACDKTTLNGDIVEHWKKHASGRKAAAFGVDCAHAQHIAESFRASGVEWAYVDANTPSDERAKIWDDLDHGNLMGVSSVGCIAVGWDHSVVSCLIMARPTQSLGLWKQMLGRGSRIHPGKQDFIVLDHAGNTLRHEPYGFFEDAVEWCLEGEAIRKTDKKPPPVATCKKCYGTFRAGPRECPFCGALMQVKQREIEVIDTGLVELTPEEIRRRRVPTEAEKKAYDALVRIGKQRGYKSGWARHVFSSKFGYHPPMEWLPEAVAFKEAMSG